MTRIYTRTGDAGETGLFGGARVRKDDVRVEAYGEVDELNACLAVARADCSDPDLAAALGRAMDELFTVGSVLATPSDAKAYAHIPRISPDWIVEMERAIDRLEGELPPLTRFIIPGGSRLAAHLHLCRAVCRRAERKVVPLSSAGQVDAAAVIYLNRLSDLLFVMARVANRRAGMEDVLWTPPLPPGVAR